MQTSCSFMKYKMSIPSFWVIKIFRIEVAQSIFLTRNLFNYFVQEFICFYCHFKAYIFIKDLAPAIFIWWYNVDTIRIYDRPKQILTISAILQHCESWKKLKMNLPIIRCCRQQLLIIGEGGIDHANAVGSYGAPYNTVRPIIRCALWMKKDPFTDTALNNLVRLMVRKIR